MVNPEVRLITRDESANLGKALIKLLKMEVYVGVPENTATRPKGVVNNAELAYLMTHGVRGIDMRRIVRAKMNRGMTFGAATAAYVHAHGSPLMNIPPRPIIEPAIEAEDNKEAITAELKLAAAAALADKQTEAISHLKLAGMTAQNAVRSWFTDSRNNWAPNAPSTITRKGSDRPLIDTGELRKSITWVLGDKTQNGS